MMVLKPWHKISKEKPSPLSPPPPPPLSRLAVSARFVRQMALASAPPEQRRRGELRLNQGLPAGANPATSPNQLYSGRPARPSILVLSYLQDLSRDGGVRRRRSGRPEAPAERCGRRPSHNRIYLDSEVLQS